MSNQLIKGIFIDVEKQTIEPRTIKNDIHEFYSLLKCEAIDCPTRYISGVKVIIVCDDNGALKGDKIPSIIDFNKDDLFEIKEIIYGNVFICKFDGIDDFTSLSEDEILKILMSKNSVHNKMTKQRFNVLVEQ